MAATYWGKLTQRAQDVHSLLMGEPGKKFTGEELATAVSIPHGKYGIAGVLSWPAIRAHALGRNVPWVGERIALGA